MYKSRPYRLWHLAYIPRGFYYFYMGIYFPFHSCFSFMDCINLVFSILLQAYCIHTYSLVRNHAQNTLGIRLLKLCSTAWARWLDFLRVSPVENRRYQFLTSWKKSQKEPTLSRMLSPKMLPCSNGSAIDGLKGSTIQRSISPFPLSVRWEGLLRSGEKGKRGSKLDGTLDMSAVTVFETHTNRFLSALRFILYNKSGLLGHISHLRIWKHTSGGSFLVQDGLGTWG